MIESSNCLFSAHQACTRLNEELTAQVEDYYCIHYKDQAGLRTVWRMNGRHVSRVNKRRLYYPVESIVGHKTVGRQRFFLVHWETFGIDDRTWEPEKSRWCDQHISEVPRRKQTNIFDSRS